jgi:hypothetical protein
MSMVGGMFAGSMATLHHAEAATMPTIISRRGLALDENS